ncbi:MAG: PA0069 family radical SAM protein [Planctomycetota bacterium]
MAEEPLRGRGAVANPPNRFAELRVEADPSDAEAPAPGTEFFRDDSRTVIARNESPDVGFEASVNPYRGCEHGCAYCYARPTHEFLGFSAGLDFETKILVKEDAPRLLRRELSAPSWTPRTIAMSGVTDPYQPVERRLGLTRRCLEVLAEFRNPVAVVTKNRLVARDADLLAELARHRAAAVFLSVTTLHAELAGKLEPRASRPELRLEAIAELARAGVPVGVLTAPVIPGLNDHEIPAVLRAAARAGARFAGYVLLRLPFGVRPLFEAWLERHEPLKKGKVLGRIRGARSGRLNDPRFGTRMAGEGGLARQIAQLFRVSCRRAGLSARGPELSVSAFRRPGGLF